MATKTATKKKPATKPKTEKAEIVDSEVLPAIPKRDPVKRPAEKKPPEIVHQGESSVDDMIRLAIQSKTGVEQLERLMKLKHEHEEREARRIYHEKFCELQADLPAINKTKEVTDNSGRVAYRYAPLEDIVEQIKPFLQRHRFSYRWSEGLTENKGYKRVYCHIVGYGHEETSWVDVPVMEKTRMTNAAQQAGSSSTYGKRYSLCAVLGVMVDDDDDGRSAGPRAGQPVEKSQPPAQTQTGGNVDPQQAVKALEPTDDDLKKMAIDLYNEYCGKVESAPEALDTWMSTLDTHKRGGLISGVKRLRSLVDAAKKDKDENPFS